MIQHQVHRLVVADGERIAGLLEQLDLLSFLSNHSYLITVQIVQAQDLDALARRGRADHAAGGAAVPRRHAGRPDRASWCRQLNAKLFERTWQLIAPPDAAWPTAACS